MPAWPGGPCPECGEEMPAQLIHCMSCRALLNTDLEQDSVEIPAFVPLQEISCIIDLEPEGYYVGCPHCQRELRIHRKYEGKTVSCKKCNGTFPLDLNAPGVELKAYYGDCPHCSERLRIGLKYRGMKVACKQCAGKIQLK